MPWNATTDSCFSFLSDQRNEFAAELINLYSVPQLLEENEIRKLLMKTFYRYKNMFVIVLRTTQLPYYFLWGSKANPVLSGGLSVVAFIPRCASLPYLLARTWHVNFIPKYFFGFSEVEKRKVRLNDPKDRLWHGEYAARMLRGKRSEKVFGVLYKHWVCFLWKV